MVWPTEITFEMFGNKGKEREMKVRLTKEKDQGIFKNLSSFLRMGTWDRGEEGVVVEREKLQA